MTDHQRGLTVEIELLDASTRLASKQAVQIMAAKGVILARQLYPRDVILELGALVEERYAELARLYANDRMILAERGIFEARAFYIASLNLRGQNAAEFLAAPVRALADQALGAPTRIDPLSFVRRVEPDDVEAGPSFRLPFHQDEKILNATLVNVWTPLRDCGRDAPGLEVVAADVGKVRTNRRHKRNKYGSVGAEISAAWVAENFGGSLVAPEMAAGDAFVFLGTTIHRTHLTAEMTERRYSVDLRLTRG